MTLGGRSSMRAVMPTKRSVQDAEHYCRFCEQPIASGSGVLAAPRLAMKTLGAGTPMPLFGKAERFHSLCVPSGYRTEKQF
jgi:hypothetical protein